MEKKKLGKSGFDVSRIGLGTAQFGIDYSFMKRKTQDEVDELLDFAVGRGINMIDTGISYGDSEEKIGRYLSENRNDFIVATKLMEVTEDESKDYHRMKSKLYRSAETSLKRLCLSRLHLVQLHYTFDYIIRNEDFWGIIADLKEEGVICSAGVSLSVGQEGELIYLLNNCMKIVDFLQIPFNILDRKYEEFAGDFKSNCSGVISRSTFLKGILTCDPDKLPLECKALLPYKEKLHEIANRLSVNTSDLAMLFVYNSDFIDTTIISVNSIEELEMNIMTVENKKLKQFMPLLESLKVEDRRLINPINWKSFQ
jgi:aryl-alcohol dehydrogenase-like predicted oxidoreductase